MNINTVFEPGSPPHRGALREYVVRQLLAAIMLGKIEPGSHLVATDLARLLNVSATPVREAIVELRCLGMISMRHNKGAYVLEFGRTQLSEFYHMRRLLECETARLSCGKVSRQKIADLKAQMTALAQMDDASWLPHASALDIAVHRTLRDHCGNQRLIMELTRYTVMGETLRELLDKSTSVMRASYPTIAAVVAALEKGCTAAIGSAMHDHVGIVARFAEELLFAGR